MLDDSALPGLQPGELVEVDVGGMWCQMRVERVELDDMGRGRIMWTASGSGLFIDHESYAGRLRRVHPVGWKAVAL